MFRKISIFLIFFLYSCVENLIHISIFDNGSYIVNYTSIGDKDDLLDSDFVHPKTNEKHEWITSLAVIKNLILLLVGMTKGSSTSKR